MAKEEFQANWRGARKYQFDEETRRKQAALDREFPDPDPAPLPQPDEPIRNTEATAHQNPEATAHLPKSRPRRRRLSIATMLLLVTVASIAGYVTTLLLNWQPAPTNEQRQTNAPETSLPTEVPLPPNRPLDGKTR